MKQYSKRKTILSILLSAILVIASFPLSPVTLFAEDELTTGSCGENVTYSFDSATGTLTLSGTGDMYDYEDSGSSESTNVSPFARNSSIEAIIINEGITNIGDYAFCECYELKNVIIPEGVTSIGVCAFNNSKLSSVFLPNSLTDLSEGTFLNCGLLTEITIPDNITKLPKNLFASSGLTNITIPSSVAVIEEFAFSNTKLSSFYLPENVAEITGMLFSGCNLLESITVSPDNMMYDSRNNCNAIIRTSDNALICGCSSASIPDTVSSIERYAFYGMSGLTSITIPGSVSYIGINAFYWCKNLAEVNIAEGVESVLQQAFSNCPALNKVVFPKSVSSIGAQAFLNGSPYPDVYVLNKDCDLSGYDSIGRGKIYGIANSTAQTYAETKGLSFSVICTDGTENHDYTQTYVTGDDDKTYCRYTCSLCGYSYDELAENIVFGKCGENAEYILDKNTGMVTVSGDGAMTDYNSTDNKSPFADYTDVIQTVIIENGITTVGDNMFNDCALLDIVNLPESITSIGNASFCRCTALETITLPDSVAEIGDSAFEGCTALLYINFPDNITSIGASAFKDCTALTDIAMLPANFQSLGANAFENCRSLKSLSIPDSLTVIPDAAFKGCETLTGNLNIPNGVTAIGSEAFSGCANITSVTVSDSVTSIGASCFNKCTGLEKITILNKACDIDNASETIPDTATIYGFYQSTPQQYAEKYNHNYVTLCNDGTEEHTFDETSTATCTEAGIKTYTCSVCGYTYDEEQDALEHSYEAGETVAPTCTEKGYTVYTCTRCGDTYNGDVTEPKGHSFINYVSNEDATCTENGTETAVCENGCGETDTHTMESTALGHTYESKVVAPTYDAEGYTEYTCSRCGDTYKTDFTDKLVKDEPTSEEEEKEEYQGPHSTDYERFRIIPGRGQIKVAWSIDEQMSGYEILFSTDGSSYQSLADIKVTDNSYYIIHGLQPGQNYYVKLQAYCMFGDEKIIMDEESVLKNVTVKR